MDGFYDRSYLQVDTANLKQCEATSAALKVKGAPHFECIRYRDRFFLGHSNGCDTIAAGLADGSCVGGNGIQVECDEDILTWDTCVPYSSTSDEDVKAACQGVAVGFNQLIAEYGHTLSDIFYPPCNLQYGDTKAGFCVDTTTEECDGADTLTGHCHGSNNIQCCPTARVKFSTTATSTTTTTTATTATATTTTSTATTTTTLSTTTTGTTSTTTGVVGNLQCLKAGCAFGSDGLGCGVHIAIASKLLKDCVATTRALQRGGGYAPLTLSRYIYFHCTPCSLFLPFLKCSRVCIYIYILRSMYIYIEPFELLIPRVPAPHFMTSFVQPTQPSGCFDHTKAQLRVHSRTKCQRCGSSWTFGQLILQSACGIAHVGCNDSRKGCD